jgi:hypothetical protein
VTAFAPLLGLPAEIPDPRRAREQIYKLLTSCCFSILAIVTGGNSYRGIVTFIDAYGRELNAFGLNWRRAPAHTAIRYILKGLDPTAVEPIFRRHAALLQAVCAKPGQDSVALDGKTLQGSFDNFNDRAAAQVLCAFATDIPIPCICSGYGAGLGGSRRPYIGNRSHHTASAADLIACRMRW